MEVAELHEPARLVSRLLGQLTLHGLLQGLAGMMAARRDFPVEALSDVAVLANHQDGLGVEERQHADGLRAFDDAVDRRLAVRKDREVLSDFDPLVLVDGATGGARPGHATVGRSMSVEAHGPLVSWPRSVPPADASV